MSVNRSAVNAGMSLLILFLMVSGNASAGGIPGSPMPTVSFQQSMSERSVKWSTALAPAASNDSFNSAYAESKVKKAIKKAEEAIAAAENGTPKEAGSSIYATTDGIVIIRDGETQNAALDVLLGSTVIGPNSTVRGDINNIVNGNVTIINGRAR